ncbi:MAG TPA: hypothetical protein VM783_07845 [Candidatus Acidoferrum sp.]|nr:hypothetical protein [Candidatus Acidoferrum sp.]
MTIKPEDLNNPFQVVLESIVLALNEWHAIHTPEEIKRDMFARMDKAQQEILLKLLGFNKDSWNGGWGLDYCNGRSGESAAGDYLRQQQAENVKAWLDQVSLPKIPTKAIESLTKEYQNRFDHEVTRQLDAMARKAAAEYLDNLMKPLTATSAADQYNKVLELLKPKQEDTNGT